MGLIGHNGAGKSTTIKSLVSIISSSSGRILVDGQDLSENRLAIKRKIGYVADSPDLFLRTHVLEVAEQVCDRIAILKKGHLIYCGSVEDLRKDHPDQSLESIYLSLAGRKEEVSDASQGH
ncbi:ABC transporter ATP-binding protein [Streptococcus pneumoniae]|nr:ABC transporter ATP-binding protein [Streptococcus pneumoniae]